MLVESDPFPEVQKVLDTLLTNAQKDKVITKKESKAIYIQYPSKLFVYQLPKIHKQINNPPGRPIISGINSSTCNLSHFIDIYLQDYVHSLDSYLKDSDSLIRILQNMEWTEGLNLLTMDVTALYSNIEHERGLNCVEEYRLEDKEIPNEQRKFLIDGLGLNLKNYFFTYDGAVYHQRRGTAMGTRVAPSFANLFMGKFEEIFIYADSNPFKKNIKLYKRYINDLIFLWLGDEKEALEF